MFGKKKSAPESLVDKLRRVSAENDEKKRQAPAKEKSARLERLYQECLQAAQRAAEDGKREARVAYGETPLSPEHKQDIQKVLLRLQAEKLKATTEVVESSWFSEDTGRDFTRHTQVIVMTW